MSSMRQHLFLFFALLFNTLIATKGKLLKNDMSQFLAEFLQRKSVQKMRETSKPWRNVKIIHGIYQNILPKEEGVAVFRNLNTLEIMWERIKFTKYWKPIRKGVKEELESHLRGKDAAKWNAVFKWFVDNRITLIKEHRIHQFLKVLLFTTAENVDITLTGPHGYSTLMISAMFGFTEAILSLIRRGADVNQKNKFGEAAIHFAALNGNVNACAALLENNANIDALDEDKTTPLMFAAKDGNKAAFQFLIAKGANETLIDVEGFTASELVAFERR